MDVIGRRDVLILAILFLDIVWGAADPRFAYGQVREPVPIPAPLPDRLPAVDNEPTLTLEELEQLAMSNNPSLARAAARVGAATGNWIQAGLRPNPTIGYDGQQLGSGGRAEQHGIVFSQEIVRGGKLPLSRRVADRERWRAEQEVVAQQLRVLTDVRTAFYQVLVAQHQIDLTDDLLRVSTQGAGIVSALARAKEAGRTDVLQAELEVEQARILLQNARNRQAAAWQGLSSVVGIAQLPANKLSGDAYRAPRMIDFQQALQYIKQASPEIGMARAEIDRARAAWQRACAEPVPNVSLQGMVNVVDNGIGGRTDGGVAITLPVPVYNRNQGAILQAQQEVAAAERSLEQLEWSLQHRLAFTFERYANARNQIERYRDIILPAAAESLALTRKTYEAGETSFLNLLVAQRTYFQMNVNHLEAVLGLRIAETEIDGYLLNSSLQAR